MTPHSLWRVAALAAAASGVTATLPPAGVFPRASSQQSFHLPLAGQAVAADYNLILVADKGHDLDSSASGICANLAGAFNATEYVARADGSTSSKCELDVSRRARLARGLHMAHDEPYAAAVTSLEEALAGQGHQEGSFDGPTLFSKPYRAHFLTRLATALAASGRAPRYVCETGFGAGHSALLWIALSVGPAAVLPTSVAVHSFDHGLSKHIIPAHDYLDERWPDNLFLYLGDSYVTVPQMGDYYPEVACDVVYVDGSMTRETVAADLAHFKPRAAPDAVVVLANAGAGGDALAAWEAAVASQLLAWEGTVLEAPHAPDTSDALVYGRYR